MALNSDIKIFRKGRICYLATKNDTYTYVPEVSVVTDITKGSIHLKLDDGTVRSISPNSRLLTLTKDECHAICNLLNQVNK